MKKTTFIFVLVSGIAVMSTACTSTDSTKAPETTQTAPTSAEQPQSAQSSMVDSTQQNTAVEGDAKMEQSQSPQANEEQNAVQQPTAQ